MRIDITIPNVGESITEVEIGEWFKQQGESVGKNEALLLLETDKATAEVHAPESGTLLEVLKRSGESAAVGEVVARLETSSGPQAQSEQIQSDTGKAEPSRRENDRRRASRPATRIDDGDGAAPKPVRDQERTADPIEPADEALGPGEREIEIIATKERAAQETQDAEAPAEAPEGPAEDRQAGRKVAEEISRKPVPTDERRDETVPMTLLRRRIAERLLAAQHGAALLTTFNEIDMSVVLGLRETHGDAFRRRHGVKLGFMSFFVKAAVAALLTVREINAEIKDDNIVYHHYCDIGVAVGGGKGLVVPVLRSAEHLSFADIERAIADFAERARDNRLKPDELQGGTFTITNGGVYGSLLSTPIVNPPQSAILGLHAIQDRPIAHSGAVAVRPMMYTALTYDHRLIDGREAVLFLKQIKSLIEDPARLLLEF